MPIPLGFCTVEAKAISTVITVFQDYAIVEQAINQANPRDTVNVSAGSARARSRSQNDCRKTLRKMN